MLDFDFCMRKMRVDADYCHLRASLLMKRKNYDGAQTWYKMADRLFLLIELFAKIRDEKN